jgi:hypothetical protein
MSRAPLYPPNKEAGVAPPPTVSLSDIRNIARITKNPYVPVGLAQALTHGGILGDLAAEMIDASRDVHTDEAKKNRCTSIENSFSVIATLLPVAEKQLASLNKAEFAEKIISIQKWDRVKRMLEILVSIIEKIGKQDFPQQNNLPDGIANVVNKIHEKLCLEDAVPALRRQTPYTPADFKATTATFTPPALQEVNSRLTGFESEIGSYLKLLQAGWTLVAVAVGELGGNKLASGRGRAISRNQKSREISVFESNFKALNTPSPNA